MDLLPTPDVLLSCLSPAFDRPGYVRFRSDRPRPVFRLRGLPEARQHFDLEGVEGAREGEGERERQGVGGRSVEGTRRGSSGGHRAGRGDAATVGGALVGVREWVFC